MFLSKERHQAQHDLPFTLLFCLTHQPCQVLSPLQTVLQLQLSQHGTALAGLRLALQLRAALPLRAQSCLSLSQLAVQQLQLRLTAAAANLCCAQTLLQDKAVLEKGNCLPMQ